jgi:hypothetical protein
LSRVGADAALDHFETVAGAVQTPEEKEALLHTIQTTRTPGAAEIAQRFVADPDVGTLATEILAESSD